MPAPGSKAQLVRAIAEFETRQVYEAILRGDYYGSPMTMYEVIANAAAFDWSGKRADIESVLSKLSIDELRAGAACCAERLAPLKAGRRAKALTLEKLNLLDAVRCREVEGHRAYFAGNRHPQRFSVRSVCRTKGKASANTLEKRYRDVRKKWDATERDYFKSGEHFERVLANVLARLKKRAKEEGFTVTDD